MSFPESRLVTSINNLLRLTSDMNSWSSKMVISHRGQSLIISSAAQGSLSSTPIDVFPPQNIPYPGTKYCFDENIFFGCGAKELLVKMLQFPNCIDGCKLVSRRPQSNSSIFRKGTWTFVCLHGIVMNDIEDSHFHPDSVGKLMFRFSF
jgi:hypothetical protein